MVSTHKNRELGLLALAAVMCAWPWAAAGGSSLIDNDCPGFPEVGMEVTLEFGGRDILPFFQKQREAVLLAVADVVVQAGVPNANYVRVQAVNEFYNEEPAGGVPRRLLDLEEGQEVRITLVVLVPDRRIAGGVQEALLSEEACAQAQRRLEFNGVSGVEGCRGGSVEVFFPAPKRAARWGMTTLGVFFLGVGCGVVSCALFVCLALGAQQWAGCSGEGEQEAARFTFTKEAPRMSHMEASSNPTFELSYKLDSSEEESSQSQSWEGSKGSDADPLAQEADSGSLREVGLTSAERFVGQLLLCSVYMEEIVPNDTMLSQGHIKTRVVHRKLKVRDVPLCHDPGSNDPAFLVFVGPTYCLNIEVRKDKADSEAFPFGCIDHVVISAPDGTDQTLPLVTLTAPLGFPHNQPSDVYRHRAAAIWDPAQHKSASLSVPTAKADSLTLELTIVFRVFGSTESLCQVRKLVSVRMRGKGEVRHVDKPYQRPEAWLRRAPCWARVFARGVAILIGSSAPMDPVVTLEHWR